MGHPLHPAHRKLPHSVYTTGEHGGIGRQPVRHRSSMSRVGPAWSGELIGTIPGCRWDRPIDCTSSGAEWRSQYVREASSVDAQEPHAAKKRRSPGPPQQMRRPRKYSQKGWHANWFHEVASRIRQAVMDSIAQIRRLQPQGLDGPIEKTSRPAEDVP
jgi:hypothetical protein